MELHVHLDTSLSYSLVKTLNPDITPHDFNRSFIGPKRFKDLSQFIDKIVPALALLQTRQALALAVEDLVAQLASDNVIHGEIRFAPLLHMEAGLSAEEVVETALQAMHKAAAEHKMSCGMILCTLRHYTQKQSMQTAELVTRYAKQGVVALDLAADEAGFPLPPHIGAFEQVRAAGVEVIAHAGEAKGPQSVIETINQLKVSRMGHGVRAIEHPDAVDLIKEKGIHLEICPSCNLQTHMYSHLGQHPVDELKRLDISLNINTDARTISNVTLDEEYFRIYRQFGWTEQDFIKTNIDALNAAFIPQEQKDALFARHFAALQGE